MSQWRNDWLSGRWVILAADRAGRPNEFRTVAQRQITVPCPFCAGQERETPPAVAQYAAPPGSSLGPGWQVRVVPNKYPAVRPEGVAAEPATGLHPAAPAVGVHEVIIESPRHVVSLGEVSDEQAELTLRAYQDRLLASRQQGRLAYGLVFKNARADGGASLEHSHSQLIATQRVPPEVAIEVAGADRFFDASGRCAFCTMLEEELAAGCRVVACTESLVAYCPFASRFPYEMWIVPREHAERFEDAPRRSELARLLRRLIRTLERLFPEPAYNYWIHTAPWDRPAYPGYHWHIEVVSRLSRIAGFELGAGCFINPVSPEEAASRLRAMYDSPSV